MHGSITWQLYAPPLWGEPDGVEQALSDEADQDVGVCELFSELVPSLAPDSFV